MRQLRKTFAVTLTTAGAGGQPLEPDDFDTKR
jgi:hypothetical protein